MTPGTQPSYLPGITLRSVAASLCAMLLMGMHIQYTEVILKDDSAIAEQSLPGSVLIVFLGFLLLCGAVYALARVALLTRQELLCVLFTMLIAAPMMTQGMWHRFVGLIASPARTGSFGYLDAYSDKLWPHGRNLVENAFAAARRDQVGSRGQPPAWEELPDDERQPRLLPVLRHLRPADGAAAGPPPESALVLRIPLVQGDQPGIVPGESFEQLTNRITQPLHQPGIVPGEPYLVSFLVHPTELGPDSYYFIRLYQDDDATYQEVYNGRELAKPTFLHRTGFLRIGNYGAIFSRQAKSSVRVELGLRGYGTLAAHDPKVFSVAALEGVYQGKRIIRQSAYDQLPLSERANLIVRPDHLWTPAGLRFLLAGYIPVRDWSQTIIAWSVPIALLLLGTLAVNVLMRRQWVESERYPFPLFRIPQALLGEPPEAGASATAGDSAAPALAAVWRSRLFWAGVATAVVWGGLRGWNLYDQDVPSLEKVLAEKLSPRAYISDPAWGGMWNLSFNVHLFVLGMCLFFDLNVLASLVVGFFIFRSLYWVGEWSGFKIYAGYPFRYEQAIGAYVAYAAVVLLFARKYLARIAVAVWRNDHTAWQGELFSYRAALLLLLGVGGGWVVWATWLEVPVLAILIFFGFLLLVGFVATKFRAECGLPSGYFTPYNAMLFMSLLGGMSAFGAKAMLVCLIASGFLSVSVFFFIPGAQMELLEFGRRYRVQPRHLLYTALLGILGGLLIGGWVFLSNAYAVGGKNIRYQWAFGFDWFYGSYKAELAAANTDVVKQQTARPPTAAPSDAAKAPRAVPSTVTKKPWWQCEPAIWAYLFGAGVTILLAVLRQLSAGWATRSRAETGGLLSFGLLLVVGLVASFHPAGFILGSAHMLEFCWADVFLALVLRFVVLKLGGAATVKNKLLPFAVGLFVGAVTVALFFTGVAAYLRAHDVERIFGVLP